MPNGYFNNQVRNGLTAPNGPKATGGSKSAPAFKEKPGFITGAPGKTQKDRSGGVKRAKEYPGSDGI